MSNPQAVPILVDRIHRKGNTWTLWVSRKPTKMALRRNDTAARLQTFPVAIPQTLIEVP